MSYCHGKIYFHCSIYINNLFGNIASFDAQTARQPALFYAMIAAPRHNLTSVSCSYLISCTKYTEHTSISTILFIIIFIYICLIQVECKCDCDSVPSEIQLSINLICCYFFISNVKWLPIKDPREDPLIEK